MTVTPYTENSKILAALAPFVDALPASKWKTMHRELVENDGMILKGQHWSALASVEPQTLFVHIAAGSQIASPSFMRDLTNLASRLGLRYLGWATPILNMGSVNKSANAGMTLVGHDNQSFIWMMRV